MTDIIVIEIENPGNLGAIARAMANFGLKNLVLVNPKCSIDHHDAKCRAKHAQKILEKAKIVDSIDKYDYLIGTTAKLGTYYNLPRSPLTPEQMAEKIEKIGRRKVGLIIGREGPGLTNEEIRKCDFVVTIPGSKYNTLNISHACAILFYELFKTKGKKQFIEKYTPINKKEKEHILKKFDNLFDTLKFSTEEKRETQKIAWKRILGKAMLTKREGFVVFGLLKKLLK